MSFDLSRKLAAEFVGTAMLLAVVVGSGIMAERLSGGNAAVALIANSIAIGAGLVILIYGFGVISGAHFNPVVTLTENLRGRIDPVSGVSYIVVQLTGAFAGTVVANLMFGLSAITLSTKVREGVGQYLGEFVATFGLITVIRLGVRFYPDLVGALVACYIVAGCWFTSSTSFANPAVTIARSFTDTFTGISPENVPMFIVMQLIGAIAGMLFCNWLLLEVENDG